MSRIIRASVAMASYNGEKYIYDQVQSILSMIGPNDEIIVSDDHSIDQTQAIIRDLARTDERIRFYVNPKKGLGSNFGNALRHCQGKYIFYSDQDDIWIDNKIDLCIQALDSSDKAIVVHDGFYTNATLDCEAENPFGKTLFNGKMLYTNPTKIWIKNKGATLGCCMAFKSQYIKYILPIPNDDHDVWTINLLARLGGVHYLYKKLILHRMHGANVSVPHRRNLRIVITTRLVLLYRLYIRILGYKLRNLINEN